MIIAVVLIWYFCRCKSDGLVSKPSEDDKAKITEQILNKKEYFVKNGLNVLRREYKWIDPILYEQIRHLSFNNQLNKENILKLL